MRFKVNPSMSDGLLKGCSLLIIKVRWYESTTSHVSQVQLNDRQCSGYLFCGESEITERSVSCLDINCT